MQRVISAAILGFSLLLGGSVSAGTFQEYVGTGRSGGHGGGGFVHHGGGGHVGRWHGGYGGNWGAGYRHWGGYGGFNRGWGYGGFNRGFGYGGYGFGYVRPYYNYGFGAYYRPFYGYNVFYRPYYSPIYYVGFGYGGGYGYPCGGFYGASNTFYNPYAPLAQYGYASPTIGYSSPAIVINRIVVRNVAPRAVAPAAIEVRDTGPTAAPPVTDRIVSLESKSRALKAIRIGDEAFRAGRYSDALRRYLDAANDAPTYAEAFFRKGQAYVALSQYRLAANSFKKGLALSPKTDREGFSLDSIYGAGSVAKGVHMENLAAAATMDDHNADAYFLLGVMLRYNGESERANRFFAKAATLSRDLMAPVAVFVPEIKAKEAEVPVSVELGDEI